MSSSQGGKKAYEDENDVPFGWAYLEKLLSQLNEQKAACDGRISFNCRLTDAVVFPRRQALMIGRPGQKNYPGTLEI